MITKQELDELLSYDPANGVFTWKSHRKNAIPVGSVAGSMHKTGYIQIKINYVLYKAHRLAWLTVYGEMPRMSIDHINCNKSDNRIENLREATRGQNSHNRGKLSNNSVGLKGVTKVKGYDKWRSQIRCNGEIIRLGSFGSPEDAYLAYCDAAKRLHGEFARI